MNYLDTIKRWEAEGEATRPAYRKSLIDEKTKLTKLFRPRQKPFPSLTLARLKVKNHSQLIRNQLVTNLTN
jgi:hypothetical protein